MEFNAFQNKKLLKKLLKNEEWNLFKFSDVFLDNTKLAKKIKKEDYLKIGKYPIIDQGKKYIAGYTNYTEAIYDEEGIIFGDHTRIIKYVNFPLFLGADGTKLLGVKLKKDCINIKYLYYFLKTIELPSDGYSRHFKYLKEIIIAIPSIKIQNKIVEVLDMSYKLIENRKKQIKELDLLVKSKFIEMFGDPVTNLKKWDKVAIGEMFEIKTGATPSRKENSYWEGGTIPWVKTTELKEYIINETEEYITEDGFNNSSVNLLPKDTILIAMYGQGKTRGMTGKLGIEATTNQACAAILPNNNENMDFVWYQLRLLYDELRALGQGGSQPNLNTNLVKTYQLIFPPVELQNEFERFIKHIDKLKFEMEKSLKELEDNFNSLMQKAFNGELFN